MVWGELKDLFRDFGDVTRADIANDKSGRSAGWGVVEFAQADSAGRAIEAMNGRPFEGRTLGVRLYT